MGLSSKPAPSGVDRAGPRPSRRQKGHRAPAPSAAAQVACGAYPSVAFPGAAWGLPVSVQCLCLSRFFVPYAQCGSGAGESGGRPGPSLPPGRRWHRRRHQDESGNEECGSWRDTVALLPSWPPVSVTCGGTTEGAGSRRRGAPCREPRRPEAMRKVRQHPPSPRGAGPRGGVGEGVRPARPGGAPHAAPTGDPRLHPDTPGRSEVIPVLSLRCWYESPFPLRLPLLK